MASSCTGSTTAGNVACSRVTVEARVATVKPRRCCVAASRVINVRPSSTVICAGAFFDWASVCSSFFSARLWEQPPKSVSVSRAAANRIRATPARDFIVATPWAVGSARDRRQMRRRDRAGVARHLRVRRERSARVPERRAAPAPARSFQSARRSAPAVSPRRVERPAASCATGPPEGLAASDRLRRVLSARRHSAPGLVHSRQSLASVSRGRQPPLACGGPRLRR